VYVIRFATHGSDGVTGRSVTQIVPGGRGGGDVAGCFHAAPSTVIIKNFN
jgi:hypothetical protein